MGLLSSGGAKVAPDQGVDSGGLDGVAAVPVKSTKGKKKDKKQKIKKKKKNDAKDWKEEFDHATGVPYYTNKVTGEISWDVPASWDAVGEDGAILFRSTKKKKYDPETGEGYFLDLKGDEAYAWKAEVLKSFYENTPRCVSGIDGDEGKRIVFPGIFPVSPLVRVAVCESSEPPRHRITVCIGDPKCEANQLWQPVHYMYGFACEMPHSLPYFIESRREPAGSRLKQTKNPQQRDFAKWVRKKPQPMGFYAFPEPLPGSKPYYLDWSSGPDRYVVSDDASPQLGWLRCMRFSAYKAMKFHCLEAPPMRGGWVPRYRVHRGHWCPLQSEWNCLFAFFAFESDQVPGTSRYYMQQRFEPHFSTRIAKEPSTLNGWKDYGSFCAFDVPMPGTARFSVDFLTADTESREGPTEVSRVYAKDTWEPWVEKIFFYAFPAPTLLFPPGQADEHEDEHEDEDNEAENTEDQKNMMTVAGQAAAEN